MGGCLSTQQLLEQSGDRRELEGTGGPGQAQTMGVRYLSKTCPLLENLVATVSSFFSTQEMGRPVMDRSNVR